MCVCMNVYTHIYVSVYMCVYTHACTGMSKYPNTYIHEHAHAKVFFKEEDNNKEEEELH